MFFVNRKGFLSVNLIFMHIRDHNEIFYECDRALCCDKWCGRPSFADNWVRSGSFMKSG